MIYFSKRRLAKGKSKSVANWEGPQGLDDRTKQIQKAEAAASSAELAVARE